MALKPISTVQTYAQVLGIISMPTAGTASANSTTGMYQAKLSTTVSQSQRKALSCFSFALR